MKIRPEFQKPIQEILSNFDFDKVLKVMQALDWEYAALGRVPNKEELIALAEDHLESVCEENSEVTGSLSGGFIARRDELEISLSFEVCGFEATADQPATAHDRR